MLEQFVHWHHHPATHEREPVSYLVSISDTIHDFIDGPVVAGAFLLGVDVGFVTAAIAVHEIPREIGDVGVLVDGGFGKRQTLACSSARSRPGTSATSPAPASSPKSKTRRTFGGPPSTSSSSRAAY